MKTIDVISKNNSKRPLNIDFMTPRIKTYNDYFSAPIPTFETLEKNLFVLLKNSKIIDLDQKYYMKPHYLSYDIYGTTILDYILMYVNGIHSMEDFILEKVIIPSLDSIISISTSSFRNSNKMETIKW